MSPRALLQTLLHWLDAMARAVCYWKPRARLRFLLSILWKRFPNRPKSHSAANAPADGLPSKKHTAEVCYSVVPPSAAASQTSLHVPGTAPWNSALSLNESHHSSRTPSIRSARSYHSVHDDEEMRRRARVINAEQREGRIATRQWARVAVSPSPAPSPSRSRLPSAHQSRVSLPSPSHSVYSISRPSTPCPSRPGTSLSIHPPQSQHSVSDGGYAVDRPVTPEVVSLGSDHSFRTRPPSLEINTTIAVQPPSPTTSPNSSRPPGIVANDSLLLHSGVPRPPVTTSVASSPTVFDEMDGDYPKLPQPRKNRFLRGITPADLPRYQRRATTAKVVTTYELSPLTTTFAHTVPNGKEPVGSLGDWIPFTHAEGSLYFYHPDKKIWTNAYMYERLYHDEVEECVAFLECCQQIFLDKGLSLPVDCELVIEIGGSQYNDDDLNWQYYYVDHLTRTIFWLQRYILWKELATVKGTLSPDHINHKIKQFYWNHVFHFPEGRRDLSAHFGKDIWSQLLSFMHFNALDTIISPRSTSFFSDTELAQMKKMVKLARDQSKEKALLPEQLSAVARIQMLMAEQRFLHAHGQLHVRLKNNDSIHPDADGRKPKSWPFHVVGLSLFRAPFTLLEDLHNVTVDSIVQEYAWRKYFKRLLEDWDRLVLQGTVILTANVSFLAIPDVIHFPDEPSGTGGASAIQSWVQPQFTWSGLLSYISTLLALGSVMAGLLLARLNRFQIEQSTDAAEACEYLNHHTSVMFDLEPLAVIYSLPYALLIWGTGFFLAALLSFTFDSTDTATRSVVGAGAVVVTGLLLWSILSGKLMIMNKIWVPFTDTLLYEKIVVEMPANIAEAVKKSRSAAAIMKLSDVTSAYLKRAPTGAKRETSDNGTQADAPQV